MKICAIVAMDQGRVIGYQNTIPWHLPEDLKRFSSLTRGQTVLMGRKTYESLPEQYRPLPNRKNIVVTRNPEQLSIDHEVEIISDPVAYVEALKSGELSIDTEFLWVIGGQQVYELLLPLCDELFITRVKGNHSGDAFFPEFEHEFQLTESEAGQGFAFERYSRKAGGCSKDTVNA